MTELPATQRMTDKGWVETPEWTLYKNNLINYLHCTNPDVKELLKKQLCECVDNTSEYDEVPFHYSFSITALSRFRGFCC